MRWKLHKRFTTLKNFFMLSGVFEYLLQTWQRFEDTQIKFGYFLFLWQFHAKYFCEPNMICNGVFTLTSKTISFVVALIEKWEPDRCLEGVFYMSKMPRWDILYNLSEISLAATLWWLIERWAFYLWT